MIKTLPITYKKPSLVELLIATFISFAIVELLMTKELID